MRRGSGVGGRGGISGGASAGDVSGVRSKSKSARSEVAGVAIVKRRDQPAEQFGGLLRLEGVEELTVSHAPSTTATRLMILGTPLPRFLPFPVTIFESKRPQF